MNVITHLLDGRKKSPLLAKRCFPRTRFAPCNFPFPMRTSFSWCYCWCCCCRGRHSTSASASLAAKSLASRGRDRSVVVVVRRFDYMSTQSWNTIKPIRIGGTTSLRNLQHVTCCRLRLSKPHNTRSAHNAQLVRINPEAFWHKSRANSAATDGLHYTVKLDNQGRKSYEKFSPEGASFRSLLHSCPCDHSQSRPAFAWSRPAGNITSAQTLSDCLETIA